VAERVGKLKLGAGVAATEIGDAEIGAQQIRAISEKCQLIATKLCGFR